MDTWLEAYRRRLGLDTLDGGGNELLARVQRAHLQSIPFENLTVLAGQSPDLTPEALFEKMVRGRRGGYCFEQNSLGAEMLRRLGYSVQTLAARVRRGVSDLRPHTHMLLKVASEGEFWLVDCGFGGEGPAAPLPLREGSWEHLPGVEHGLRREGDLWVLQCRHDHGSWLDLYAFDERVHHPVDYVMYNHFTATFPQSLFVNSMLVALHRADGYSILFDGCLRRREGRETRLSRLRSRDEVEQTLREQFGLDVPTLLSCPLGAP